MAAKNDVTGDRIASKANSQAYRDGMDRIFGTKKRPAREMLSDHEEVKAALRRASDTQRETIEKLREMSKDQDLPSFDEQTKERHGDDYTG